LRRCSRAVWTGNCNSRRNMRNLQPASSNGYAGFSAGWMGPLRLRWIPQRFG
jgi:hypothetical protein